MDKNKIVDGTKHVLMHTHCVCFHGWGVCSNFNRESSTYTMFDIVFSGPLKKIMR